MKIDALVYFSAFSSGIVISIRGNVCLALTDRNALSLAFIAEYWWDGV
jgi:hypothetical protein